MTNRIRCRLNVARQVTLRIAALAAFAVPVAVGAIQLAPPDARPRFDVASIRPCQGDPGKRDARTSPGRLTVTCHTLATLIRLAYIGWDLPVLPHPSSEVRVGSIR